MKNTIYKITVNNWDKYNSKKKKGHESIMLSCRFFDDAKIAMLSGGGKLLYLGLLLRCGDVASNSIVCSQEVLLRLCGGRGNDVARLLHVLQELQLVTLEILESLYNIKEYKRKEETIKEEKRIIPNRKVEVHQKQLNREIWEAYETAFFFRYKTKPMRNAKVNSQISQIGKRLGIEAVDVIKFYLTHNDAFYLKTTHSLDGLVKNAESLAIQLRRGRPITASMVDSAVKGDSLNETLKRIAEEGI
jgi:hypothetical protein